MKLAKKILTIVSLSTMGLAVGFLISALFGAEIFEGYFLAGLLSLATIAVGSAFSITALNYMSKKKIISIISLSLLSICTIFGFIVFWSLFDISAVFGKIVSLLAIATILFVIIISLNSKLGKRYKVIQGITYSLIIVLDILLTLLILGVELFDIKFFLEGFCVICLVTFAMFCALAILGKKPTEELEQKSEKAGVKYVTITENEYLDMKDRIKKLEEQLKSND